MRRLTLAVALLALAGVAPACKKKRAAPVARGMQSVVEMNDASVAGQLKSGFYGIEGGSWRWTDRNFSVQLLGPANAQANGARLHLKFAIPDAVINKVGPMELRAAVHAPGSVGMSLDPEHYTKSGTYEYTRDLDASVFQGKGAVTVDFTCDKSIPPTSDDRRELALIALSAGLEPR